MINVRKKINLNSSLTNENNELEITLSSPCFDKANINTSLCLNQHNEIKIANNEIILANILIKNTENIPLDNLKLKICDTDIFKFIPSSLKNKITKELYISENTKGNIFSLGSLGANNNINIEFCMKAYLNNSNFSINNPIKLLSFKNNSLESEKFDLVKADRNELQISANPNKNLIELQNIGSKSLTNIIYRYEIPSGCNIDTSTIKYHCEDIDCTNIAFTQIKNNILFKIHSLPKNSKLKILLIHERSTPTLFGATLSIK